MNQVNTKWAAFIEDGPFLGRALSASVTDSIEVCRELSPELRRLVASDPALSRDGHRPGTAPLESNALVTLTPRLGGLWEMGSRFHWGCGRALFALGPLQATRETLNPEGADSKWALMFEKYEAARYAFAGGAYSDAFETLKTLGDSEEWRVHFLFGLLRLGFAGGLHAIIDLESAEVAFRTAARFAQARHPECAVQALAAAGFCALRLDAPARASGYFEAGERLGATLPELLFIGAHARLRRDDLDEGHALLKRTLMLDRGYALRLGPLQRASGDSTAWTGRVASLRNEIWESCRGDIEKLLAQSPGVVNLPGHDKPAIAGRRLATFISHGASLPLLDALQTWALRDELMAVALEGASETLTARSHTIEGPDINHLETKVTERPVREKVVKRESSLFRKEEAEWVTNIKTTTETVNVKRKSQVRRVEVVDGAGQLVIHHEMVHLSPGTFSMGSAPDEEQHGDDEIRHDVTLSRPFFVGRWPVDQQLWEAVCSHNPAFFHGVQLPVEQVSFFDAATFCNALSELEGLTPCYNITETEVTWAHRKGGGYRLLTEAEWEYACRAGSTTAYSHGQELSSAQGTFARGKGAHTTPWGEYPANPWGLFDVHGNVWEWCFDGYGRYPTNAVMDPVNDTDIEARVARGGSWASEVSECRSATRTSFSPWHHHNNVGFRLAIDAIDEEQ